ncbi:MAG: DUF3341 domain-containing protein [Acetobacteraceae bacterium]|jgi:hypothetical protein
MSAGLFVAFTTEHELTSALPSLREARLGAIETYTPAPIESGPSILPLLVLIAGVAGAIGGFCLQSYANIVAYPIDIGGRPQFSWPAFVPIAFENGVLAAVLTGFVGYFVVNRLPRLYEPVDECDAMRRAMRDLWCVAIRTDDPRRARELLRAHTPVHIEELPA